MLAGIFAVCCLLGAGGCGKDDAPADAPTAADTQTAAETQAAPRKDYADTALVGNSYIDGFRIYDAMPGASCLYRVGLSVHSVFSDPMTNGDDTNTPVIELLKDKDYRHIFLFFGENELGWDSIDTFRSEYGDVIDTAREYCPDAAVYLVAVPPVSAAVSEKNENRTNNDNIQALNEQIQTVATDKNAVYIDSWTTLVDANGCLPDSASADGVHPAQDYTKKWAGLLQQAIMEGEAQ